MPAASEYHRSRLKLCVSSNGHNPPRFRRPRNGGGVDGGMVCVTRVSAWSQRFKMACTYLNLNGPLRIEICHALLKIEYAGIRPMAQRKAPSECSPLFSAEVATVVFDAFATTRGVTGCYTRLLTGAHCNDASIELSRGASQRGTHRLETDRLRVQVRLCECPI